jgi:carbon-monoxide dehydrogenase medium subunit
VVSINERVPVLLPRFHYHEPETVGQACELVTTLGRSVKVLAGGTDLLVNMKKGVLCPEHIVSLGKIPDLRQLRSSDGFLSIGACLSASEIAEATTIGRTWPALSRGAGLLGTPLIRNLATIAGNLVTARPAADLPAPLLAYGARVHLQKTTGDRWVSVENFFLGPGQTVLASDEILTGIELSIPPAYSGASYIKLGKRKTLEISLVNVAVFISLNDGNGTIRTARVVLGAVAPAPMRARSSEELLLGEEPSEGLFAAAGEAAAQDSRPIDDFRASAAYRRAMVAVLTRRALFESLEEIRSSPQRKKA